MRHALRSLECAVDGSPFYIGYAHEAAARAACCLNDLDIFREHWTKGNLQLAEVADGSERSALHADLASLTPPSPAEDTNHWSEIAAD